MAINDNDNLPPKCPNCGLRFSCICLLKPSQAWPGFDPERYTQYAWQKVSKPEEPEPEELVAPPGTIVVVIVPLAGLATLSPEQAADRINSDLRYKADQIFIQKDSGYQVVKDRIGETLLPDYLDEKLRQGLRNLIGDE